MRSRINALRICFLLLALIAIYFVPSCGGEKKHAGKQKLYQVKEEPLKQVLHFTGTVQPLKELPLTSPMAAILEKICFDYGARVKKGETIFVLNSSELQKQYNDALTEYLKAKDSYSVAQSRFVGTRDLWRDGLVAKNAYLSEKLSYATSRITLIRSTRNLLELIEKLDGNGVPSLSNLNLGQFDKVQSALNTKHNLIYLRASEDGVLLLPPKDNDSKVERLSIGTNIKANQVLGVVGDLSGIRIEIHIPEVEIGKVYRNMAVEVSGVAFSDTALKGRLVAINAQASNASSGMPVFSAVVEANNLTEKQQEWIKVGMSASVALMFDEQKRLMIPVSAVKLKNNQSTVCVKTPSGKTELVSIETGEARADKVVVRKGLKAYDVIVYDY